MSAETPEAITVRIKEACRMTGIGRSKLYELIGAGEIETVPLVGLRSFIERRVRRC